MTHILWNAYYQYIEPLGRKLWHQIPYYLCSDFMDLCTISLNKVFAFSKGEKMHWHCQFLGSFPKTSSTAIVFMCVIWSKNSFFSSGGFGKFCILVYGVRCWVLCSRTTSLKNAVAIFLPDGNFPLERLLASGNLNGHVFSIIWTTSKISSAGVTTQQRYQIGVDDHREVECKRMEFQLAEDRQIPGWDMLYLLQEG